MAFSLKYLNSIWNSFKQHKGRWYLKVSLRPYTACTFLRCSHAVSITVPKTFQVSTDRYSLVQSLCHNRLRCFHTVKQTNLKLKWEPTSDLWLEPQVSLLIKCFPFIALWCQQGRCVTDWKEQSIHHLYPFNSYHYSQLEFVIVASEIQTVK